MNATSGQKNAFLRSCGLVFFHPNSVPMPISEKMTSPIGWTQAL